MEVRLCPNCGSHNAKTAWNCFCCGSTLSMNTAVQVENYPLDYFNLIEQYSDAKSTDEKEELLNTLVKIGLNLVETERFLDKVIEVEDSKVVRTHARVLAKQHGWDTGKSLSIILPDNYGDEVEESDLIDDELIKVQARTYHYAAAVTIISRLFYIPVLLLSPDITTESITSYGISFFGGITLGLFLLQYRNWARILLLVGAIVGTLVNCFIALVQMDLFTATSAGVTQFGYAASLVFLLGLKPSTRNIQIGTLVFVVFSAIPFSLMILLLAIFRLDFI